MARRVTFGFMKSGETTEFPVTEPGIVTAINVTASAGSLPQIVRRPKDISGQWHRVVVGDMLQEGDVLKGELLKGPRCCIELWWGWA